MGVEYDPEDSTSEVKWNSDKEDIATIDSINKKTGKITTNKENKVIQILKQQQQTKMLKVNQ